MRPKTRAEIEAERERIEKKRADAAAWANVKATHAHSKLAAPGDAATWSKDALRHEWSHARMTRGGAPLEKPARQWPESPLKPPEK
jgi:hypothetical protein